MTKPRPLPDPFAPVNPKTCKHEWEPHLWEAGTDHCPYCASYRQAQPKPFKMPTKPRQGA